jgi:putative transposase
MNRPRRGPSGAHAAIAAPARPTGEPPRRQPRHPAGVAAAKAPTKPSSTTDRFDPPTLLRRPIESGQYTSIDYTQTLDDHGVLASVGSVGDAYDNALAESFVDSFKTELIADRVWRTRAQLELAVVEYIGWFNDSRLHQALGDLPPSEFERLSQTSTLEIALS